MQTKRPTFRAYHQRRAWLMTMFFATALATSCSMPEPPTPQAGIESTSQSDPISRVRGTPGAPQHPAPYAVDIVAAQRLPNVPLADLYPALLARANAGDLNAKRQLFLALNECRMDLQYHAPPYSPDTTVDPALLAAAGISREQFLAEQRRRSLLATDQTLEQCEALPQGVIGDTAHWLRQAAEGGDIYAQLAFFNYLDLLVGPPSEQIKSPEKVEKFNTDSMRYLQGLADQRIPEAFDSLSSAYGLGVVTPKDPVRAYAYKKAGGDLAPNTGSETVLQIMEKDMTSEQVSKAKELARSLVQGSTQ